MILSDEQKAANDALDQAITDYFRAFDSLGDGQIVMSWLVIGACTEADEDDTRIALAHPGGTQPAHIAAGLLSMGERLLFDCGDDE